MPPNIVELIYPPDQIYIANPMYQDSIIAMDVECLVPTGGQYTINRIPYVSAENQVRILSQTCFLFAEHIISTNLIHLGITAEEFREAAISYRLQYRKLNLNFPREATRGTPFPMRFTLENWRRVRRINDYIIFTFANRSAVTWGKAEFVYAA
jgi:hypothetical protein